MSVGVCSCAGVAFQTRWAATHRTGHRQSASCFERRLLIKLPPHCRSSLTDLNNSASMLNQWRIIIVPASIMRDNSTHLDFFFFLLICLKALEYNNYSMLEGGDSVHLHFSVWLTKELRTPPPNQRYQHPGETPSSLPLFH